MATLQEQLFEKRLRIVELEEQLAQAHYSKRYYIEQCQKITDFAESCGMPGAQSCGMLLVIAWLRDWRNKIMSRVEGD